MKRRSLAGQRPDDICFGYPYVQSLIMDIATLEELRDLCGKGEPVGVPPHNLTPIDLTVYDEVAKNKLRLGQEKIPFDYSNEKILAVVAIERQIAATST